MINRFGPNHVRSQTPSPYQVAIDEAMEATERLANWTFKVVLLYFPALMFLAVSSYCIISWLEAFEEGINLSLNSRGILILMYLTTCFMLWFLASQIEWKSRLSQLGFVISVVMIHVLSWYLHFRTMG
jgi:hypothetical protein